MPAVVEKCGWLQDKEFRRGNPQWLSAFAKLKTAAEAAKIEICRTMQPYEIWIEDLLLDATGKAVELEYRLTPENLEEVVSPYVLRRLICVARPWKRRA